MARPRGEKNTINNLNKGRANKKALETKIELLEKELDVKGKCLCGADIEIIERKDGSVAFSCSNIFGCKYHK